MDNRKENIDLLTKRVDELCDVEPSQVILDIRKYEDNHLKVVLTEYGRFVSQFELYYDLTVEMIMAVNFINKSTWPQHRGLQFMLLAHNLKPIYSAFDRLIKGFYEDSLVLIMPVYEAFIKIIYISCYPSEPWAVITSEKVDSRKFNLTNFLKDELKLTWVEYGIFSMMSHSNAYSVLSEAISKNKGSKEPTCFELKFDKKLFELGVNEISFMLLVCLRLITSLFATSNNDVLTKEMIKKAQELIELRRQSVLLHPEPYWPQVMKDLDDVFKLIECVELGESWKKCWSGIRGGVAS